MKASRTALLLTAAALAFGAAAATPTLAQMKEQTVTVGGAPMYPSKNIIQNAVNSKDHTTLVAAVKAAGLVETLQGAGPFTVFAPTNAAFAKLPPGTVDALLKPEAKEKLVAFLAEDKPTWLDLDRRAREAVHAILTMPEYQLA